MREGRETDSLSTTKNFGFTERCLFEYVFRFSADPRKWSREDVSRWLQWMSEVFNLNSVRPDRFQMNGKALCLMTVDMFLYRVPEGGNILYQDFQRRLRNAVALQN